MQTMFCGGVMLRWEDCNARVARIFGEKVESGRFFGDTGSVQNNQRNAAHARAFTALSPHQLFLFCRGMY